MTKPIILSLGGSIIAPKQIDTEYLQQVVKLIRKLAIKQHLVVFTGGGATARTYQQAAKTVMPTVSTSAQDWVGIKASWLNAELLKQLLGVLANATIITNPVRKLTWSRPVWVGAGWKPGRSTDYDAVRLATENSIDQVINLSNIDYVYTKDPNNYPDAKKITKISWAEFRTMIGNTWDPGLHVPFDPIAAKLAEKEKITVKILNGRNLNNVLKAIQGKKFQGTEVL